ncbi:MAG: class I SAM-dependent methyltransferase [Candidatus Heteroscillospira sp.]|jgi:ubiquinone/menaquinone biosynthesis C-methylase UbiE
MDFSRNINVFSGMSQIYERGRPAVSPELADMLEQYLGHKPDCVVDVGCGTGKSLSVWTSRARSIYGLEPNKEFHGVAERKFSSENNMHILDDYGEEISLPDSSADLITCVQVFHWLDTEHALSEFNRILVPGGIAAACDFSFPPVSIWEADRAYAELLQLQKEMDRKYPELNKNVFEGDKAQNLRKFQESGYFAYCRNASFICSEQFDAQRYVDLAFSQSILRRVEDAQIPEAMPVIKAFKETVFKAFGSSTIETRFCMQLTIGVKK